MHYKCRLKEITEITPERSRVNTINSKEPDPSDPPRAQHYEGIVVVRTLRRPSLCRSFFNPITRENQGPPFLGKWMRITIGLLGVTFNYNSSKSEISCKIDCLETRSSFYNKWVSNIELIYRASCHNKTQGWVDWCKASFSNTNASMKALVVAKEGQLGTCTPTSMKALVVAIEGQLETCTPTSTNI